MCFCMKTMIVVSLSPVPPFLHFCDTEGACFLCSLKAHKASVLLTLPKEAKTVEPNLT